MPVRSAQIVLAAGLAVVAGALPGAAGAAPGDLDPSFGDGGIVTTDFGGAGASASAVALLPNGKIVVAGDARVQNQGNDFALARYLPDGSLDPVFDADGKVTTDFSGFADVAKGVAIQSNGRIVAAGGLNDFQVARYRRDGSLDPTFGGDGKVETDLGSEDRVDDVVIQADGKIVVAGTRLVIDGLAGDFAVVRYNPDGSLDASFGSDGKVLTELAGEALAVALQHDGRTVVVGTTTLSGVSYDVAVVRYNGDGSLDTSFDGDGIVIVDLGAGANDAALNLVLQVDGKIVIAGVLDRPGPGANDDFLLARFNPDGSLDTAGLDPYLDAPFGVGGTVTTDFSEVDRAHAVAIEPGGKLVVAGEATTDQATPGDFALARYNLDGSLDATFGTGGKVTTDISAVDVIRDVAVQSDGSIVVAGSVLVDGRGHFAVARYLAAPCCGEPAGVPGP